MKSHISLLTEVTLKFLLMTCLAISLCTDHVHAQDAAALRATYGRGVHAYFRGQSMQADRLLTEVVQSGTTDPRVFYFRAMARIRAGRSYEAENDMQIGAALEARNPGLGSTISKSLERVQGTHRRKLEKYRRQARLERLGEQRQQSTERYEQIRDRESAVLRREVDVPLEQLTGPGLPTPAGTQTPAISSPSADRKKPSSVPSPQPVGGDPFDAEVPQRTEPADVEDDPFSTPAAPAEQEPADNIFDAPESAPTEDADDDPFAVDEANSADPFGNENSGTRSDAEVASSEKVKPSKLVGILGRVVGSAMPWQGIELPQMPIPGIGPVPEAGLTQGHAGDDIELGPFETDSNVVLASADESDPFEDSGTLSSSENQEPQAEGSTSDEVRFEDAEGTEEFDDPFADF